MFHTSRLRQPLVHSLQHPITPEPTSDVKEMLIAVFERILQTSNLRGTFPEFQCRSLLLTILIVARVLISSPDTVKLNYVPWATLLPELALTGYGHRMNAGSSDDGITRV